MRDYDRDGAHCSDIRRILQEIDPLFDVEFHYPTERYEITFNGGIFDRVGYNEIDRQFMEDVRMTYWLNSTGQIMDWIDTGNARLDASGERKQDNWIRTISAQMREAAVDKKYFGGVAI